MLQRHALEHVQRLRQRVVADRQLAVGGGGGVAAGGAGLGVFVGQMVRQIRFGVDQCGRAVAFLHGQVGQRDVRLDAFGLDRGAVGRVVARGGDLHRVVGIQRQHGLHHALAERALAHGQRAVVVLQRAGDDLGGRGGAVVGQHDHRRAVELVARMRAEAHVGVLQPAAGGDDDAGVEEIVADRHCGGEQTAGVVAQIQHGALLRAVPGDQRAELFLQIAGGVVLELADADIGVTGLQLAHPHAADGDALAHQVQVDQLAAFRVHDGQLDLAARLAAQLLVHAVDILRIDQRAVDLDDAVARLDPGARRRGVVDRRNDAQAAVHLQHLDAEAAVLAGGVLVELGQALLVEVFAVRIELAQHAGDRRLHQGLVVDLFHVGLAHHLVDAAEIADVVQVHRVRAGAGMRRCAAAGGCRQRDRRRGLRVRERQRQQQRGGQQQGRATEGRTHGDHSVQRSGAAGQREAKGRGRHWDNRTKREFNAGARQAASLRCPRGGVNGAGSASCADRPAGRSCAARNTRRC